MASSDFKRHEADLPRPARRPKLTVDSANLKDKDVPGSELNSVAHRNTVHDPTVNEMLAGDYRRRKYTRKGAGGKHRVDDRS